MPLTLTPPPVAQVVKQETHQLHCQVEAILLPRLSNIRTADDYARILQLFYGFFHPVEEAIQQFITEDLLTDINDRRSSELIIKDLASLGDTFSTCSISPALPEINNVIQAFGALYVLEGSTLGGRMIAKMMAKNAAFPVPETALNFFNGYKENTGVRWTNFVAALNKQTAAEAIALSANETFLNLKAWMEIFFEND